ncbi:ribbon-helix-helix domain-containing protein, partial [Pseudomonas syringae]|uniref:ribbon-helix-helix domain-containing protein n=1 Tax=Pseudomonas syringae TaxID=317 RepID=UPI001BAEDF06
SANCVYTVSMTSQTVSPQKRRGPAPTGKGTPVGVRVQPDLLAAIDRFIEEEAPGTSRPEAVRRLATEQLIALGIMPLSERTDQER